MTEIRDKDPVFRHELQEPQPAVPVDEDDVLDHLGVAHRAATADRKTELAHRRLQRRRVNEVLVGKVNWNGVFTLTDGGATATVVQDERVTPDCEISLHPLTANAASLVGKVFIPLATLLEGTAYRADPVGRFTVQHPIVAAVDFTFRYSIKG